MTPLNSQSPHTHEHAVTLTKRRRSGKPHTHNLHRHAYMTDTYKYTTRATERAQLIPNPHPPLTPSPTLLEHDHAAHGASSTADLVDRASRAGSATPDGLVAATGA